MPTPSYFSPMSGTPTPVDPEQAPSREYVLERDGDRDLAFVGWIIGHAQECRDASGGTYRCVAVTLFATESGSMVGHACRWKEEREEPDAQPTEITDKECSTEATFFVDTHRILQWLKEDAGGKLGPTSKAAWEQACDNWEELKGERYERI